MRIPPTASARNIGVMFNNTLSMYDYVAQMCKGAWMIGSSQVFSSLSDWTNQTIP